MGALTLDDGTLLSDGLCGRGDSPDSELDGRCGPTVPPCGTSKPSVRGGGGSKPGADEPQANVGVQQPREDGVTPSVKDDGPGVELCDASSLISAIVSNILAVPRLGSCRFRCGGGAPRCCCVSCRLARSASRVTALGAGCTE